MDNPLATPTNNTRQTPDRSRILFLDINGVLDSASWYKREHERRFRETGVRKPLMDVLDPTSVGLLNNVIDRTNAAIVISSAWRNSYGISGTAARLHEAGFNHIEHVIGCTGNVNEGQRGRGKEILAWLEEHPDTENFCVVDDNRFDIPMDSTWDMRNHIQLVSPNVGITARDVEIIVRVLTTGFRFPSAMYRAPGSPMSAAEFARERDNGAIA